ncbi:hypothetical protein ACOT81_38330 [Streptomyces sp. WI04-05B]|uniref:hypothetical protein n=1 Tax=Streptomyces TaxID=1883 RepID=UPI0029BAD139|nr:MULTISPECIES: hypothetical protein [unclassified Streptomyces]MDX2545922.1 hypothetical protein [Streptomyces sp. WI04-05B]MDX2586481.1 hypothetical protein [Streptomyces sp. WI04-05A]
MTTDPQTDRPRALHLLEAADFQPLSRDVVAYAYGQPGPVVLEKKPESWQMLFHTDSPLTGGQEADLPVYSVVRTAQLRAGHDWEVDERRLAARGLARYGFADAVSAGHALTLARAGRRRGRTPHRLPRG